MRPVAFHVESIVFEPNLKHIERRRVQVIDLEFSEPQLQELIEKLPKRPGSKVLGSIRIRFKGRMVLE